MDFNNYVCVHMYVYVWCVWPHTCMPQWICEGQRTTLRNLFSLSLSTFPWVLGLNTAIRLVQQVFLPLGPSCHLFS